MHLCAFFLSLLAGVTPPLAADATNAVARQEDVFRLDSHQRPSSWILLRAGDLGAIFDRKEDGVRLLSLFDLGKHLQLSAQKPLPLFAVSMRNLENNEEVCLVADAGWEQVRATATVPNKRVEICWQTPKDKRLGNAACHSSGFVGSFFGGDPVEVERR